jgi:hypothetical protein
MANRQPTAPGDHAVAVGRGGNDVFYVKERFLFFTHWVPVQVQSPWILHSPADPGNSGPCPASQPIQEPAKDLVCPAN